MQLTPRDVSQNQVFENVYKTKSGSRNKRNSVHIEGDILYGKPAKTKTKLLGIADIVRDEDNIETNWLFIYELINALACYFDL